MRWPVSLLPRAYFPEHGQNRMVREGDLSAARMAWASERSNNLEFLLESRYGWMSKYITSGSAAVEIGAGAGFATEFIKNDVILTEIAPYPWVDLCVDATNIPFAAATLDVVICANVLHHLAAPMTLLLDLHRCLRPGGYVLINEANPSFLLLLALRLMRHEGWSFDVDVFDPATPVKNPADPWSGNNAISELMFGDRSAFRAKLPGFEVAHDSFAECLIFPLSGGVTAKSKTVELPLAVLRVIDWIDGGLCRLAPQIFAMRRSIALRKAM
jgi:SAM-dependent methyltransferase